ncbi:MAG: hypothetical protein ACRD8U_15285 [Pyrinomonadaceae bacterium]
MIGRLTLAFILILVSAQSACRRSPVDPDIVIIRGNPAASIKDIRNVTIVFKDGVGYDSAKLIDSVQGQAGIE